MTDEPTLPKFVNAEDFGPGLTPRATEEDWRRVKLEKHFPANLFQPRAGGHPNATIAKVFCEPKATAQERFLRECREAMGIPQRKAN